MDSAIGHEHVLGVDHGDWYPYRSRDAARWIILLFLVEATITESLIFGFEKMA